MIEMSFISFLLVFSIGCCLIGFVTGFALRGSILAGIILFFLILTSLMVLAMRGGTWNPLEYEYFENWLIPVVMYLFYATGFSLCGVFGFWVGGKVRDLACHKMNPPRKSCTT
jgi:hypothetical protein